MFFTKPVFNILTESDCKVHHLFCFLFRYNPGLFITANIPFLSKLIKQGNQVNVSLNGMRKGLNDSVMMSLPS